MAVGMYFNRMSREVKTKSLWRDVLVELLATFFLMSVQAALPLSWDVGLGGVVQVALGMGFIVCTMAWSLGDFGGGHMNPAVSVAMALRLEITALRALLYVAAQVVGAMAGAGFVYAVTPSGKRDNLAATRLDESVDPWQGVLTEAWITCILVITIIGSTNKRRKGETYMATIPIGFAVATGIFSAFQSTGASMNPARSFGPAVVKGIWDDHWVYWVGPILGGVIAVLMYTVADIVDIKDVDNGIKKPQTSRTQVKVLPAAAAAAAALVSSSPPFSYSSDDLPDEKKWTKAFMILNDLRTSVRVLAEGQMALLDGDIPQCHTKTDAHNFDEKLKEEPSKRIKLLAIFRSLEPTATLRMRCKAMLSKIYSQPLLTRTSMYDQHDNRLIFMDTEVSKVLFQAIMSTSAPPDNEEENIQAAVAAVLKLAGRRPTAKAGQTFHMKSHTHEHHYHH